MHAQFPSTTTVSRAPQHALLAAFAALAIAGGTVGVVALVNNDGSTVQAPSPSIAKVVPDRVLDGSPILRGTSDTLYPYRHAMAPANLRESVTTGTRVLDGSPILRGHAAAFAVTHPSSVQGTLRPPVGRPFGFRNVP